MKKTRICKQIASRALLVISELLKMALVAFADTNSKTETDKEMNSKSQLIYTLLSSIAPLGVRLYEVPWYKATTGNSDSRGEWRGVVLRRREVSRRLSETEWPGREEKQSWGERRGERGGELPREDEQPLDETRGEKRWPRREQRSRVAAKTHAEKGTACKARERERER